MRQTPAFIFASALCVIALVGLTRVYDAAPPQAIGITIVCGTLLILALSNFNKKFRSVIESISIEQLICWHAIRAPIGAAFLVMASEGLLPDMFAERAGYGDLFTAISGVLVVAFFAAATFKVKKPVYLLWNAIGIIDLLLAVGTGIYLGFQEVNEMVWIARLPLLLVPTFILPVLFSTHFIMFYRLLRGASESSTVDE